MKNILIILSFFALLISACDKKSKRQYSKWTVNGESFSTNDVEVAIGKARCGLAARDMKNRFTLDFSIGYELPTSGTFDLNTIAPGQQICGLTFYYNGKYYYHTQSSIGKLHASEVNKKARYTLPASWYVSYESPATDSVTISGEFNEP